MPTTTPTRAALPNLIVILATGTDSIRVSPPTDPDSADIGGDTPKRDSVEPTAHTEPLIQQDHPWIGDGYDFLNS